MPSVRAESPAPAADNAGSFPLSPSYWWAYLRQIFILGSFFGIALTVSMLCGLLALLFGNRIPPAAPQAVIRGLFRFWLRMAHLTGVFHISFPEVEKIASLRGAIIAPNHPSLLDAVLILAAVPKTVCIVRAALIDNLCLGGAAKLSGFVANDGGPILIRQGVAKIQQRENLLIFPEGTRTHPDALNAFKKGFALIAVKTGAPIQTVFIEREAEYLAKGVSLFARTPLPITFRVHVGEVIRPGENESAQQLSARLHRYFSAHLERHSEAIRLSKPLS
ncbi:lysophospholipid acyltransferase family protein [soil metagenome]